MHSYIHLNISDASYLRKPAVHKAAAAAGALGHGVVADHTQHHRRAARLGAPVRAHLRHPRPAGVLRRRVVSPTPTSDAGAHGLNIRQLCARAALSFRTHEHRRARTRALRVCAARAVQRRRRPIGARNATPLGCDGANSTPRKKRRRSHCHPPNIVDRALGLVALSVYGGGRCDRRDS